MDGNGRWAEEKALARVQGHREGIKAVRDIVEMCRELRIPYLTLYAFSKENWDRPEFEVKALMHLLKRYLTLEEKNLMKNNIRLKAVGDLSDLPLPVYETLKRVMKRTRGNKSMVLNLALSYGGRTEIIQAMKKLFHSRKKSSNGSVDIDEQTFSRYLYTRGMPDPDLLIRTSGRSAVSSTAPPADEPWIPLRRGPSPVPAAGLAPRLSHSVMAHVLETGEPLLATDLLKLLRIRVTRIRTGYLAPLLQHLIGLPIAFALMLVGFLGISRLASVQAALPIMARAVYETSSQYPYTIIPLFIVMGAYGEISGMSRDLYNTFDKWLRKLPGGLGMATIAACAGFAAISGSSVAAAATMGTVAYPEMKKI
jgi:undecaprenyl diphosphate synthase